MNIHSITPGFKYYLKIHQLVVNRVIWPHSIEEDNLHRWRAHVLSSILMASMFFGLFTYIAILEFLISKEKYILIAVDSMGLILCASLIFVDKIRYEVRSSILLLAFYLIGVTIILSMGPLSGGPAWLFTFSILAGILFGNIAAFVAILMNAAFMGLIGVLVMTGNYGADLPFLNSIPLMCSVLINFLALNTIAIVSISALVKGSFRLYNNMKNLANNLQNERLCLIKTKKSLEHEITERKLAEKEVWKLNQFRKSIIENVNIWLSVIDEKGNVVVWNKAAESISGYTKDKVVNNNKILKWLYPNLEYRKKILKKAYDINERDDFETVIHRSDGEKRIISWHSRNLINDDNHSIGIIAIGRDITENALAQEEKENAQKVAAEHKELALVGQVAGKMAHDFNNVLAIIMGNAEIGLMHCIDANTKQILELIFKQTLSGRNLTKNLVAFAKNHEPKQEFLKITENIDLVLNLMKRDLEGIEIIRKDQPELPELLADPGMIEHVFVNLIQNSIHATGMEQDPRIYIKSYSVDDVILIEIEDNGCGIPKEHLENIYIPSFTLKGSNDETRSYDINIKGTGYGMSNVRKYIKQHCGLITVESEFGKYTRFTITLPVMKKKLTEIERTEIQKERKHFKKRILLVEDEFEISHFQQQFLTNAPLYHTVDVARNGQVAMDLFEKNKYDFISLDYVLPGKLNGMDVYHHVRKNYKDLPILFLSGNIEFLESIKELKQEDLFLDHLSKPSKHKDYISSINKLLERSHITSDKIVH
ncbi:MAG: PAS domain S-box protein [Desulfobacterales bacterium]|nr:PAS domain S-box protein [Desulfobacterales bacterium]MCP4161966.1 PAS domain S-box protein [Deltaproteobacteria bacterium]